MRLCLFVLPALVAASLALADEVPSGPDPGETESAAAGVATQARQRAHTRRVKRLPHGDLRYCLDMKSNEQIIRCAETLRRR
jgi:hypothetical protein